jgi:hypothetical protein
MGLREEVRELLRVRGPLDDDQIAELLERNRHYVNKVCRDLEAFGEARRVTGRDGKLVTELTAQPAPGAGQYPPPPVRRLPRASRTTRARDNV